MPSANKNTKVGPVKVKDVFDELRKIKANIDGEGKVGIK